MSSAKPTPRSILSTLLKQLAVELRGAARSPDDPDAVHDLRVAIRRFSQALRVFPEVFGRAPGKKIRRRLKKMMGSLGAVRNLDVALEVLQAAKAEPGRHLLEELLEKRRNAQNNLEVQLKSWRKREVLAAWKTMLHSRVGGARSFEQARLELPELVPELLQAGNDAARHEVPYHYLHRCRLLGKRLRYTMEMFGAEMFGAEMSGEKGRQAFERRLEMLKELQDHLGGLNDCVTVMELMEGQGAVKRQIRLLLARREDAFRVFWNKRFDARVQQGWLKSLQVGK